MAFNAGTGWEVRTSAADANGGGGFSGGTSNLAAPSAPATGTATTGGTVAANTYYAVICYLDANGNPGPKSAQTSQVTTGTTSTLTVTSPVASPGAVSYAVWWTTTNGGPYWPSPGTAVAIGTDSTRTTTPATSGTQPPGADYSKQDAAQHAYTDIATASNTTITSAVRPFVPADVGNVINITSGTGWTVQRVQITAVSAANVATVDKSVGTHPITGGTGNLGGALQSLTAAAPLVVANNSVYVKSGTYAETLTLSVGGGNGLPITWIGYDATRGDAPLGTGRPLIDAASTRANCIAAAAVGGNVFWYFRGSGGTAANFDQTSGSNVYLYCKSSSSAAEGWKVTTGALTLVGCESASNATFGVSGAAGYLTIFGSYLHDNTSSAVSVAASTASIIVVDSIIEANGASGIALNTSTAALFANLTVDGNTGATTDGIAFATNSAMVLPVINCAITNNGRYGLNRTASTRVSMLNDYNGMHGNATSAYNAVTAGAHDVTTDPGYVNAAGGNFAIGTNWKAAGYPGVFPAGLSQGYMDIGAVQREEAGGAGGMIVHPGMTGRCSA